MKTLRLNGPLVLVPALLIAVVGAIQAGQILIAHRSAPPARTVMVRGLEASVTGVEQLAHNHELLIKRDEINQRLQQIIDGVTDPWGVKVTLVEVKDVELPEAMRRAMARQAEAERDRRAKVIHAIGEFEAVGNLGRAAEVLEAHPAAMQLRVLSTMTEVASERNSTLIFPLPVELLRLVDTLNQRGGGAPDEQPVAASAAGREG